MSSPLRDPGVTTRTPTGNGHLLRSGPLRDRTVTTADTQAQAATTTPTHTSLPTGNGTLMMSMPLRDREVTRIAHTAPTTQVQGGGNLVTSVPPRGCGATEFFTQFSTPLFSASGGGS